MSGFLQFGRLKPDDTVKLTDIGARKANSMGGQGGQYRVMSTLADNEGAATVAEIARNAGITEDAAGRMCQSLIRSGYAQKIAGGQSRIEG